MQYIEKLKKEIIRDFKDKNNDYNSSDRLQVSLHKIVDNFVSDIDIKKAYKYVSEYSGRDFETLDAGMYDGAIEKGLEHFIRVILYCLIEQELWNDSKFNEMQEIEEINGIKLDE